MLSPRAIAVEGIGTAAVVLAVLGFASIAAASMLGKIVAEAIVLMTMSASSERVLLTSGATTVKT